MENRIHPMMVVAAASVTLVSLLGAASIAGILPNSQAKQNDAQVPLVAAAPIAPPVAELAPAPAPAPVAAAAPAPRRVVEHKTVVHHTYAQVPAPAPAPAPVAQNSPLGIGIGAVVGGLLGNQVGSGNGRKLATIAGAVGGGYVGNEVAKRNQQQQ